MFRGVMELLLAHRHSREVWDPKQALLGRDRRIFQRVSVEIPCRLNNPLFGLESEGSTVNLSLGGVGIVAPVAWPEGSEVRVQLGSLSLAGLIVYRKDVSVSNTQCRYGIKFRRVRFRELLQLRRVLAQSHKGPLAVL
jgi:hypothetical protein